jgi:hypothetical protein
MNCLPSTHSQCSFAMLKACNREMPHKSWESVPALSRPAYSVLGESQLAESVPGFALPFKLCQSMQTPGPSLILALRSELRDPLLATRNSRETRGDIQCTRRRVRNSTF